MAASRLRELAKNCDQPCPLSSRQQEIIQLISQGLGNKEIADRLNISTATVKNHVHNILRKFRVRRRRDAIRQACVADIVTKTFAGSHEAGRHL
jgi:DNA-binding NarL/FixJ family response regulator